MLIAGAEGGVNIEEVAKKNPQKIITISFNPLVGPSEYQVRYLAEAIGYQDVRSLKDIIDKLYRIVCNCDAKLVEINPLAATPNGLVALDAKVIVDDKAAYRQEKLFSEILSEQNKINRNNTCQVGLKADTITHVPLNGTVGLISDGAGTGMLTLDLIKDAGGEAANFCEMGGITSPQVIYDAMTAVLANPSVKSLLVVLIGGFNRMDEMAEGIIKYKEKHGLQVPMIVRMCGTLEEIGKEMMRCEDIPIHDDLYDAVQEAVALAGGKN